MTDRQKLAAAFKAAVLDKIEWRSVSITPKEGQVSLVSAPGRRCVAVFEFGEWRSERGKPLKFVPTHYMVFNGA